MQNSEMAGAGLITNTNVAGSTDNKMAFTRGSMAYPSPFLDYASTFLPRTIKSILRFIAAYTLGDSLISICISKLSEYPITKLLYNDKDLSNIKDDQTCNFWQNLLEKKLKIIRTLKQSGMNYHTYGNDFISINYPFRRTLTCPKCKTEHSAESLKWKFRGYQFHAECANKKCGYNGKMDAKDKMTKEIDKLSIVHWDIMNIDIKYNSITDEHFYFYTIPLDLANAIRRGDKDIVKSCRLEVIEAVRRRKQIKLMADNIYHMKRPGPQYIIPSERGWGIPAVMAIMKDHFQIRVLKKGNEAICLDHIIPLRILFPQGTGDVSPHATINLSNWKTKIEGEIQKWRIDPNYISVVPIPLGMQNFTGDARLLMVTPEIRALEDNEITGLGIAPEIIRGGASWSGSNVSLRVVENTFLNHRTDITSLLEWIVTNIAVYLNKPEVTVKMSDFKMADDLSKKQMMLQAAMRPSSDALVSRTTATKELGFDPDEEYNNITDELKKLIEIRVKEAEGNAEAQGAGTLINSMYQADAMMEGQKRTEMHQRDMQAIRDDQKAKQSEQNAEGVGQEVQTLGQQVQQAPQNVSIPNLILVLTQRFARLASVDKNEFKIRMLAMKNSTPNLYQEIYNNMREMNIIELDLLPNLDDVSKYTPGNIPQNSQGDSYAEQPTTPAESGASEPIVALPSTPEQRPPRSNGAPI